MIGTRKPRNKSGCATGESGFNLIEVIIAMAILSVGLLAMAAMQITAIETNSAANKDSEAVQIASQVMERVIEKANFAPGDLGNAKDGYDIKITPGGMEGSSTWYTVTVSYEGRFSGTRKAVLRYLRRADPEE